jgi:hypothetical protein
VSAFCAIRKAIEAARADAGLKDYFRLDSPATAESIRLACIDDITRQVSVDWLTRMKFQCRLTAAVLVLSNIDVCIILVYNN